MLSNREMILQKQKARDDYAVVTTSLYLYLLLYNHFDSPNRLLAYDSPLLMFYYDDDDAAGSLT